MSDNCFSDLRFGHQNPRTRGIHRFAATVIHSLGEAEDTPPLHDVKPDFATHNAHTKTTTISPVIPAETGHQSASLQARQSARCWGYPVGSMDLKTVNSFTFGPPFPDESSQCFPPLPRVEGTILNPVTGTSHLPAVHCRS
ncbi:MAG TPA: hypothetical protein DDY91_04580 [Planctomycetaceae bacterium]|nr:hypothetical protein [Planctomycetaceae bacterium]